MTLTCVLLQVLGKLSTDHLNRVVPDMATCYQPISIWGDGHLSIWGNGTDGHLSIWGNGTDFEI